MHDGKSWPVYCHHPAPASLQPLFHHAPLLPPISVCSDEHVCAPRPPLVPACRPVLWILEGTSGHALRLSATLPPRQLNKTWKASWECPTTRATVPRCSPALWRKTWPRSGRRSAIMITCCPTYICSQNWAIIWDFLSYHIKKRSINVLFLWKQLFKFVVTTKLT